MSFHVGEDIGDYRIVSIIGAGSMGQVFQVEHRITKRKEALKILAAECASESQVLRFRREIEVQARLDHPNIARLHNALYLNGSLILVMELVEGESLEKKLQKGKMPRAEGIHYMRQALSALEYAHAQGIVHRDVTPGNLIIDQEGQVKLTDFGVAKSLGDYQLTNAGEIVGSLHYMPPEQVRRNAAPDPRSDIYSAAAVLYEILTGKRLFDFRDKLSLMVAQVEQQPVAPIEIDPGIGSGLNQVVLRALSKDPAARYQSAHEFREALASVATEPAPSVSGRGFSARRLMGAAALAALALSFIGAAKLSPFDPMSPPPKPAAISGIGTLLEAPEPLPAGQLPAEPVHRKAQKPEATKSVSQPLPDALPRKKRFWSKLNPFKKKEDGPK